MFVCLHFIPYRIPVCSIRSKRFVSGSQKFLHQRAQPSWESVYIVIHWQTVSLYHNSSVSNCVCENKWKSGKTKAQTTDLNQYFFFISSKTSKIHFSICYFLSSDFIDIVGRMFANGSADLSSIPGHIIPKTLKMVLDTSLLNTQKYKVHIEGKVEQSRERGSALPFTSV